MKNVIKDYLVQVKVGRKQSYKNLAIFPLISGYSLKLDYLLLDEVLAEGLIEVIEIDNEGSVLDLRVNNNSPYLVLILDGEELVGAKQDRIVNTTILIQENSTLVIPVSCVEEGRWSYNSPRFSSQERIMPPLLRAMKSEQIDRSVREFGKFRSNQAALWEEISEKAARMEAASPSMASIYEKEMPSTREYVKRFKLIDSQAGAVFLVNGEVVGLEGFGKAESFSKYFKKLVASYALDAIDRYEPEKDHKAQRNDAMKFLRASQSAEIETRPSVGLGTDYRLVSKKIIGFALAHKERILHLSLFARPGGQNQNGGTSRMDRYTSRMKNRMV